MLEMLKALLNIHLKNVIDVLPFEPNFQRFFVESFPLTDRTCHPDVGEKIHFKLIRTVSLARFTTASRDVERKTPWFKSSQFGFWQLRVKISNQVEQLDVSCRI